MCPQVRGPLVPISFPVGSRCCWSVPAVGTPGLPAFRLAPPAPRPCHRTASDVCRLILCQLEDVTKDPKSCLFICLKKVKVWHKMPHDV